MSLNADQIDEIKRYMDERSAHWQAASRDSASIRISDELGKIDQKNTRRIQAILALGGVTLLGGFGWVLSQTSEVVESTAIAEFAKFENKFQSDRKLRTQELNEELSFLANQVDKVVSARTSLETALEGVQGATERAQGLLNDIDEQLGKQNATSKALASRVQQITDRSQDALATKERAEDLFEEIRQQLPAFKNSIRSAERQISELDQLQHSLESAKELAKDIESAQGNIVAAIVENEEITQGIINNAGFPSGAVVPFPATEFGASVCPAGWSFFVEAQNRFILGASDKYLPSTKGGEEMVTLEIAQIPKHSHSLSTSTGGDLHDGLGGSTNRYGIDRNYNSPEGGYINGFGTLHNTLSNTGGGKPHNNMPPYIALYFCIKD
ncbi:MAG: hypothetical protein AAGA11_21520 [Pseudomonadota bacterium]